MSITNSHNNDELDLRKREIDLQKREIQLSQTTLTHQQDEFNLTMKRKQEEFDFEMKVKGDEFEKKMEREREEQIQKERDFETKIKQLEDNLRQYHTHIDGLFPLQSPINLHPTYSMGNQGGNDDGDNVQQQFDYNNQHGYSHCSAGLLNQNTSCHHYRKLVQLQEEQTRGNHQNQMLAQQLKTISKSNQTMYDTNVRLLAKLEEEKIKAKEEVDELKADLAKDQAEFNQQKANFVSRGLDLIGDLNIVDFYIQYPYPDRFAVIKACGLPTFDAMALLKMTEEKFAALFTPDPHRFSVIKLCNIPPSEAISILKMTEEDFLKGYCTDQGRFDFATKYNLSPQDTYALFQMKESDFKTMTQLITTCYLTQTDIIQLLHLSHKEFKKGFVITPSRTAVIKNCQLKGSTALSIYQLSEAQFTTTISTNHRRMSVIRTLDLAGDLALVLLTMTPHHFSTFQKLDLTLLKSKLTPDNYSSLIKMSDNELQSDLVQIKLGSIPFLSLSDEISNTILPQLRGEFESSFIYLKSKPIYDIVKALRENLLGWGSGGETISVEIKFDQLGDFVPWSQNNNTGHSNTNSHSTPTPTTGKSHHITVPHYCSLFDLLFQQPGLPSVTNKHFNPLNTNVSSQQPAIFSSALLPWWENRSVPNPFPPPVVPKWQAPATPAPLVKLFFSTPHINNGKWVQFYGPGTALHHFGCELVMMGGGSGAPPSLTLSSLCPQDKPQTFTSLSTSAKGKSRVQQVEQTSQYQISIKWETV